MTLDLALVTYQPQGIIRVSNQKLPQVEGVRYVVSWQQHLDAPIPPDIASRPDIIVHRFDSTGQSANRNNAIANCSADIILHADDDIIYTREGLLSVISVFEQNPNLDLATFRSIHNSGCTYPDVETELNVHLPKNYFVATFEIAFRRATCGALRCHPELGLGSPELHGGEDEVFLMNAIKHGYDCRFFPLTICTHDHPSTGTKMNPTDGNLRASGCVIALYYPWTSPLRIPLKAWRLYKSGRSAFGRAVRLLVAGAMKAPGLRRRGDETVIW